MSKYLYDSNIEFQNTLNRDYMHHSELSVDVYSDAIVLPYHCEKLKMILPKFRRIYALPNMIIYICKCIGYWLKTQYQESIP